jgi:hypothetical protein
MSRERATKKFEDYIATIDNKDMKDGGASLEVLLRKKLFLHSG